MKLVKVMACGLLAAVAALASACGNDCEPRQCSALETGSLHSNGKTYQHCLTCGASGSCETVLEDDKGAVFFDCTDGAGKDCLGGVVDAEFAYCDLH